jgi:hypothetical protein
MLYWLLIGKTQGKTPMTPFYRLLLVLFDVSWTIDTMDSLTVGCSWQKKTRDLMQSKPNFPPANTAIAYWIN